MIRFKIAAANAAPKLSFSAASVRASVAIAQNWGQVSVAVFRNIPASGMSTIRLK